MAVRGSKEDMFSFGFNMFDADGDGVLNEEEVRGLAGPSKFYFARVLTSKLCSAKLWRRRS